MNEIIYCYIITHKRLDGSETCSSIESKSFETANGWMAHAMKPYLEDRMAGRWSLEYYER